ncbi:leucyl aminopeptidase (aminopeptidase T) [Halorubrum aidingense JCM 13560]|uniref:Leucyl aminopeptidase (Aminopeptidase T) n=1 Tax=Halorubrum aidingense JCM 13560 TaxID=1230454 RepID=M0PKS0_9EURY|nr:aminopeptidase [Halorubrum aidingense]EMA70513.1 leucyl aminopeptidase (aminopeptidase T) [Halorubrum aidingense JCM 13560]
MNDGRVPELIPAVTRLAETNVRADDRVALLAPTWTERAAVTALWSALTAVGADVTTLSTVPNDVRNHPLRPVVAGAIERADVVVNCGAYAGFPPEILEFVRNGGRHLKVYATVDALTGGTAAAHLDPRTARRMRRDVEWVADRLTAADELRLTAPSGTDVTASVTGITARKSHGDAAAQHGHTAFPTGETDLTPVPGSAAGTIVVDTSMSRIGRVDTPIELTVTDGRVVGIDGGSEADRLARTLDEYADGCRSVGEFGFGMNPRTRPTGVATNDKKLRGTAHVGLGDVTAWPTLTGTPAVDAGRPAPLHLDGICRSATLRLDGELVIDDGSLVAHSC